MNSIDRPDRGGYDASTNTYHNHHNWAGSDPLCLTIIDTISEVPGREPREMNPLYSVIDPGALERLLAGASGDGAEISFSFEGCDVTVTTSGAVAVTPKE